MVSVKWKLTHFGATKVRVFIENSDTLRAETIQMRF